MWIRRFFSVSQPSPAQPDYLGSLSKSELFFGTVTNKQVSVSVRLRRTFLYVPWSSVVAYEKWWVAAADGCSALNCFPGPLGSRWVQGWPLWSEVVWCYCGERGCSIRVRMPHPVPRTWLTPGVYMTAEEMLLDQIWGPLTQFSSLEKKVRTRQACNDASSNYCVSLRNFKSKTMALSWCSPSGLQSVTKWWLKNSAISD